MRRSGCNPLILRRAASLLAFAVAGCSADAIYELTCPSPAVRLPRDEAPHCYGGEWWYYTGRLESEDGKRYGIEAVIFHDAHLPIVVVREAWFAHFAVLEEATGRFVYDQSLRFEQSRIDCPQQRGFSLNTPLVRMSGADGSDRIRAATSDGSYAMDLTLVDQRGPVLHGDAGYVPYGQYGRSFYYSRPRMHAGGTLEIDGRACDVTGEFWFDRQWGRNLQDPWLRWDWFSLRLDDGSDVMLFVFRDTDPPVASGTYVPAAGEPSPLAASDFDIEPVAFWISPHTGATYPVAWEIVIGPHDLSITVTAVTEDQELDTRATTLNVYWEGLCTITGTRAGAAVTGHAFVELTNYVRLHGHSSKRPAQWP